MKKGPSEDNIRERRPDAGVDVDGPMFHCVDDDNEAFQQLLTDPNLFNVHIRWDVHHSGFNL